MRSVSAVARALPWCCLVFRTHVSPDAISQDSLSKVFNVETSQLEGIPCHEWYSVLLGSMHLSAGVDQVGTSLFPVLSTRLTIWNSRGVSVDLFRGMKVNEFARRTPTCVEWSEALGNS